VCHIFAFFRQFFGILQDLATKNISLYSGKWGVGKR